MNLFERFGITRVKDTSEKPTQDFTNLEELLQKADFNTWDTVQRLRNVSTDKSKVFREYEDMADDVFIASALELYADDATQTDSRKGKAVWIKSEDEELITDLDLLLEELEVESRVWDWAYEVGHYGELYLKLFFDDDGRLEKYLEEVDDPSKILDLRYKGKTDYYARVKGGTKEGNQEVQKLVLQDPDSYIHFLMRKANKFDNIEINVPKEDGTDNDSEVKMEYKIARGVSILEPLRSSYRILRLLEDSLIVSRLSRSAMIRMFSVEVGTSPPKKAREMVNKLKRLLDSQEQVDIRSGEYNSKKSPGPADDPIIVPTRNGKGSVRHETIGGDVDIKNIVDIDYFRNKVFAGLKIPKAFLGFEEYLPGSMGQSPLTKLDVRYARTVKRIQNTVRKGIKDILNMYLIDQGREGQVGKFDVVMTEPSSNEENERMEDMSKRVRVAESVMSLLINNKNTTDMFDHYELVKTVLSDILKYDDLSSSMIDIKEYKKVLELRKEMENDRF